MPNLRPPGSFTRLAAAIILLTLAALPACTAKHERIAVLYSSVDGELAQDVCERFRQSSGIRVQLVSDTEEAKSTGLVNRLIAEKSRPQADVFWSGDVMRALRLAAMGIADSAANSGASPNEINGISAGVPLGSARIRMILCNDKLAPSDAPRPARVEDLARPEFARRACLANPLFGTTLMHFAVLAQHWGEERAKTFLRDFAKNGGRMVASNGEVRRRVAAGEFAFGLTDSDDASVALADAKPVSFIIPDQDEAGAVVVPCAAVPIHGGPHPAEARALVDFLTSAETEQFLAESLAAHFPLRPELASPKRFGKRLAELRIMPVNYATLPSVFDKEIESFLKSWAEDQAR